MSNIKKRFLSGLLALLCLCAGLTSCGTPVDLISSHLLLKEQRSFDEYADRLFREEMQENTINLHFTLADPKSYGIDSHKISLGRCSREEAKRAAAATENIAAALAAFDYDALSSRQQLICDVLNDHCEKSRLASSFYYYDEPLRPTTGTHSELPVLLAEYAFDSPCDVTDYLALLTCVEDYFEEIIQFEREKSKEGLFMPAYAADAVIEACQNFTAKPKKHFLIRTFNSRIQEVSGLSAEKKALYKRQNASLIKNSVIPAYQKLEAAIQQLRDSGQNDAGLCHYPEGKAYYASLVRSATGSSKSIEALQKKTEQKRNLDMAALQKLLAANPALLGQDNPTLSLEEPRAILDHLMEAMQSEFPPASNTSYEVNYVHKSLEQTLAPAFYLTAPLDDISRNVIYLNRRSLYTGIQLFTTLAHEGFPGHLYQTTGSYQAGLAPIRALLGYPGYVEGWATYVEMLSYRYAGLPEDTADMLMYNQSALLSLYASLDMGIHYDGWKLADATLFLRNFGITDETAIKSIYELIVEEPAHYLKYYIGYLEFLELKDYAKQAFGADYSDRAFHQAVIRIGPAPFSIVKKYLKSYYSGSDATSE